MGAPAGQAAVPGAVAAEPVAEMDSPPAEMDSPVGEMGRGSKRSVSGGIVARAVSWAWIGHVISQAAWFASLLILAALVPPKSFGLVSAGMVIVNIAVLIVGSGTRGAIITSERLTVEHLRYALAVNIGAGFALTAGVMALAGPIVSLFAAGGDAGVLQGLIFSVWVYAIGVVPLAVLQRELRFKQESSVRVGAAVLASVIAIGAAVAGLGVWALVLRQVLNSAFIAVGAWVAARPLLPGVRQLVGRARRPERIKRPDAGWFFWLATFNLGAMSVDYLIVGHLTNATQLGLYSLAFTVAFAPLTQFSWRLGQVILPAVAATEGAEAIERRTLRAIGASAAVLLPFVPPAMVLASWLLPAVFGHKWTGMVTPFVILLPVGVAHAIVNMVGESLSGSGNVDFATKMQALWLALMIPALILFVQADGIRGAAIAHLVVAVPIATGYFVWGAKRIGLSPARLGASLAGVLVPFAVQSAVTVGVLLGLRASVTSEPLTAVAAALCGLAAGAVVVWRSRADGLQDSRRLILNVVSRSFGRA